MKTCPICYVRTNDLDFHVKQEHPSFEVRIVNENNESMSGVGYFNGNPPVWLKEIEGKVLSEIETEFPDDEVGRRLTFRLGDHQKKQKRALTEEGSKKHSTDHLFVKIIEG